MVKTTIWGVNPQTGLFPVAITGLTKIGDKMKMDSNTIIDLQLVEDGEKKEMVDFIGDSELEEAFGEEYLPDASNNQIIIFDTSIPIDKICDFFTKKGVFISFLDVKDEYNIIFENCHISESYGNALLGDGSIEGGIIIRPCDSPNAYWRGF